MLLAAAALLALGGCYVPTEFSAEIFVGRNGDFTLKYDGVLTNAGLVPGLMREDLGEEELADRIANVQTDLERDSGFRSVRYRGNGQYEVSYERSGNILEQTSLTFVRADSRIFTIAYVRRTGENTVRGASVPDAQRNWLAEVGLNMRGELRIVTDARILDNNAVGTEEDERGTAYICIIRDMNSPAPLLIIG